LLPPFGPVQIAVQGVGVPVDNEEIAVHGARSLRSEPRMSGLAGLDDQLDCGSLLAVDLDVREGGNADEIETARGDEPPGDGDRLYGLIERARADRLDLRSPPLADDARDCARDRVRVR